jgi:hypothetical protein
MHLGFQQLLLVVYILFLALGPKRVVRWIRRGQALVARLQGKPPPPRKRFDLLRLIELTEYSSPVGWAVAALGFGTLLSGYFATNLGISGQVVPLLYVGATLLMFVATLLV